MGVAMGKESQSPSRPRTGRELRLKPLAAKPSREPRPGTCRPIRTERASPESVRKRANQEHAHRAAEQDAPGRPAFHEITQPEMSGEGFDRSRDDPRVVAEQQTAQSRDGAHDRQVGGTPAVHRSRGCMYRRGGIHRVESATRLGNCATIQVKLSAACNSAIPRRGGR